MEGDHDTCTSPDHFDNTKLEIINCKLINNNIQLSTTRKPSIIINTAKNTSSTMICGTKLTCGLMTFLLGVSTFIWTPLNLMLMERLNMSPGLPPFEWWLHPPESVYFRIYVFNITNAEAFMNGTDSKLAFQQVGPIVYKEMLSHSNATFNTNSTLTYVAKRWLEYIPEQNKHIDLNATLNIINIPLLGFASYLHDAHFFVKQSFNVFTRKDKPIVNRTIYEFLWNYTDPILDYGNKILPNLVPVSNIGMLSQMYSDFMDTVTVFIGRKWGDEKFFTLDTFQGRSTLPGHKNCSDKVTGSTEGILYSQRLTKNSSLLYWRKTLCRVVKLIYEEEVMFHNVKALKYTVPNNTYHRITSPNKTDCYAGSPKLLDGLTDISKCFFDFPMAMSLPHFYGTDDKVLEKVDGFHPDPNIHGSYAVVEPLTGIPLESCARSQSNLVIRPLKGFYKLSKFSDMVIPMFWAEYSQMTLPDYIWNMVIFTVNILPSVQIIFSCVLILIGIILIYLVIRRLFCNSPSLNTHKRIDYFTRNTLLNYEKDTFLKNFNNKS